MPIPLGFGGGGGFALRHLGDGGLLAILAAFAIVALVLYWPRIADWIERHWPSR